MSSAALARKRRANEVSVPPVPAYNAQSQYQNQQQAAAAASQKSNGFTLPQVISVIDTRLIQLETFMKESKNGGDGSSSQTVSFSDENTVALQNEIMNEMNHRFEVLASEVAELKDIVLKLQSYTMDVNKTLLEERIHILSDVVDNTENANA
jgi:transcriptional regulator CtsR